MAEIPDLSGLLYNDARDILYEMEMDFIVVSFIHETNNDLYEGTVLRQEPSANEIVYEGIPVILFVSTRDPIVYVADVEGQTRASAINVLTGLGLEYEVRYLFNATVASGRVISQDPAAGTPQSQGTIVTIAVSRGERPPLLVEEETELHNYIVVPQVVMASREVAVSTLTNHGFSIITREVASDAVIPVGRVVSQYPVAGTSQREGSSVTITISVAPRN
jgi:serine/threonine-protein kinase